MFFAVVAALARALPSRLEPYEEARVVDDLTEGQFARILGFFDREVYRQAPPIPERVVRADFLQLPALQTMRWMGMIGDSVFILGTRTGWSHRR